MSRATNPALAAKLEAERRLKEGISGHKTGLPKKLLDLFAPLDPPAHLTSLKKTKLKVPYTGIAQYVGEFAEPNDPQYEPPVSSDCPPSPRLFANPELRVQARVEAESRHERRLRVAKEKVDKAKQRVEEGLKDWDPAKDPTATGDAFKTLFVARISYEATERKLRREFEEYGPIKSIRLVHDKNNGKSRGYAFIEYEHKNDMKLAYKMGDGKKIETKRVVVDVERGRAVPNWRPRRLGGGKGGESREAKVSKKRPAIPGLVAAMAPASVPLEKQPEMPDREKEREGDREQDRGREKEMELSRGRDRDRSEREREHERPRSKELDLSRVPPPGPMPSKREYEKERETNGRRDSSRDREADRRDRDRKRDRHSRDERTPGERDNRDDAYRCVYLLILLLCTPLSLGGNPWRSKAAAQTELLKIMPCLVFCHPQCFLMR